MVVGIPKETFPNERRVAMIPALVPSLHKAGFEVLIETGAGEAAGFPDTEYQEAGAHLVASRAELFAKADILLQVRTAGANPRFDDDLPMLREGQVLIGLMEPLWKAEVMPRLAQRGVAAFAMELIPRISRAQSMDVLSSMATVAGYKAVLLAASHLPKMFPLMMTAAGTIQPARVFVIGAGVAGLQAIATARRLGAVVEAYDIRPAAKQEAESLGAKFVTLGLESEEAQEATGYAKAFDEAFYRRQQQLLASVITRTDVVITTAAVPGKRAPLLINAQMVHTMRPGSIIVDLAAEWGGNCELTHAGETIVEQGVTIIGAVNLASTIPFHASQLYSRNLANFLNLLFREGQMNLEDEITRSTLVCYQGEVVHPRVKENLAGAKTE
ncbi:NAD(P) transhydrogenase subunit alpha part 1 [bacterium HR15]|nr:NAD(P) transhydrogenase subunit alpha part 1 [bacterium HR15]